MSARPTPLPRLKPGLSARQTPFPWLKPGLFIGALAPLAVMVVEVIGGNLGANPIAEIENVLGFSALVLLMASLACTPARRVFGWTWPARVRRLLGLFAFFYVALHFLTYLLVDQNLDAGRIVDDIVKRPFITVGFAALVLLTPLAVTSTTAWIRRLGYRRWQLLHQLAYVAGVLAVIHFIWRVKIDASQPLMYAAVLSVLLLIRVVFWVRRARASRADS